MESTHKTIPSSSLYSSPPPSPSLPTGFHFQGPCAACKVLRRRCTERCGLAPYFPSNKPLNFINAHRVFGASNIVKWLQELQESERADAISSMVYEANTRIRDPVYGCAGVINQLQKQLHDLKEELAMTRLQLDIMQSQQQPLNDNASFFLDRNLSSGDW